MKKYLPLLVLGFGLAMIAATLVPPRNQTEFDLVGFGRLPVLVVGLRRKDRVCWDVFIKILK